VSAEQEKFIKAVASKVKEHGQGFEDVLRDREKENAKFTFLFDAKVRTTGVLSAN
jgi:U2-associated protein SR140